MHNQHYCVTFRRNDLAASRHSRAIASLCIVYPKLARHVIWRC